jgi:polysaccharide export outer membrane protein
MRTRLVLGVIIGLLATRAAAQDRRYVIGPSDALSIVFRQDKEMSADVTVRPDGQISLPLLNDITVSGSTPDELRLRLKDAAMTFIADPEVSVVVKDIHSRIVYITGNIAKPNGYPLNTDMTVLQLIAVAGGLLDYADKSHILVMHPEHGESQIHEFDYNAFIHQKRTTGNVVLAPGDTIVVP